MREHALALAAFEEAGDHRSACLELVSLGAGYADLGAYAEAESALARDAYVALDGVGYGRVDIRRDERTGEFLVLEANCNCGLSTDGETSVTGVHHVDRGYDDLVGRLAALGADIERVPAG